MNLRFLGTENIDGGVGKLGTFIMVYACVCGDGGSDSGRRWMLHFPASHQGSTPSSLCFHLLFLMLSPATGRIFIAHIFTTQKFSRQ